MTIKQMTVAEEIRKIYPRAGLRWAEDEDVALKISYQSFLAKGNGDFEQYLVETAKQFGRKQNGIRGHLAKFFPDIPGWDYEAVKKRDQERAQKTKEKSRQRAPSPRSPAGEAGGQEWGENEEQIFDFSDNPQAALALRIMQETNDNLFLTGEAGTGKSSLLQFFRRKTQKNVVVLAPTGVAALNVRGQTIHSFCGFGPDITIDKVKRLKPFSPKLQLLQKLQTIVIDEISMARADLLDCVDKFLRINGPIPNAPFGGLQMIFIGDLYQLPPVEKDFVAGEGLIKKYDSAYFFDSEVFRKTTFKYIHLQTIYRQKDQIFIDLLNAVRNNAVTQAHLTILNQRAEPSGERFSFEQFAIYLTTTNKRAREVNNYFLQNLPGDPKNFEGAVRGKFEGRELPTDEILEIKIGAQVMMLNNDRKKRWVNGTMGKIIGVEEDVLVQIELETGQRVSVLPYTWEMYKFVLDKRTQKIDTKIVGTFTQYPFKLAWAVTIHKAQGKTFNKVCIDLSTGTFAHGQLYVALSRCRALDGLYLKRPIEPSDILLDNRIVKFLESINSKKL